MKNDSKTQAEIILGDETKLKAFAQATGIGLNAAQELLKTLAQRPAISREQIDTFVESSNNKELKAFYQGQQDGYEKGHDAGFGKGAALALLAIAGALLMSIANSKQKMD